MHSMEPAWKLGQTGNGLEQGLPAPIPTASSAAAQGWIQLSSGISHREETQEEPGDGAALS